MDIVYANPSWRCGVSVESGTPWNLYLREMGTLQHIYKHKSLGKNPIQLVHLSRTAWGISVTSFFLITKSISLLCP